MPPSISKRRRYAGGAFTSVNGISRNGLVRLYRDCTSDIVAFTSVTFVVDEY